MISICTLYNAKLLAVSFLYLLAKCKTKEIVYISFMPNLFLQQMVHQHIGCTHNKYNNTLQYILINSSLCFSPTCGIVWNVLKV